MNRVNAFVTCSECGEQTKLRVHPDDTGRTIQYACTGDCGRVTTHDVGGVRFA